MKLLIISLLWDCSISHLFTSPSCNLVTKLFILTQFFSFRLFRNRSSTLIELIQNIVEAFKLSIMILYDTLNSYEWQTFLRIIPYPTFRWKFFGKSNFNHIYLIFLRVSGQASNFCCLFKLFFKLESFDFIIFKSLIKFRLANIQIKAFFFKLLVKINIDKLLMCPVVFCSRIWFNLSRRFLRRRSRIASIPICSSASHSFESASNSFFVAKNKYKMDFSKFRYRAGYVNRDFAHIFRVTNLTWI